MKRKAFIGSTLTVVLLVIMLVIINNKTNLIQSDALVQEPSSKEGIIPIKDIEYIALEQNGPVEGSYLDKIIFSEKDKNLVDEIKISIMQGTTIENINRTDKIENPLIISIKQKDGTYYEGEYKDNKIIFYKPSMITIKTDDTLEGILKDFKERKLYTNSQDIIYKDQVRNNNLIIGKNLINSYSDDPVFKNFNGSNISPEEYEKSLIKEAVKLGIDERKLENSLDKAREYKGNIKSQYPIIIETGTYRDKACFILTFTWENIADEKSDKVQKLGHIFTVILDEDGNEIAYTTCR